MKKNSFGGKFIPELLVPVMEELEEEFTGRDIKQIAKQALDSWHDKVKSKLQ